jgi:hypothetical protein
MSDDLSLRVMVQDIWDEIRLEAPASAGVGEVKQRALRASRIPQDPDEYVLKFRGAEVADATTLAEAGIVSNAGLIVLPRRRRPVR